MTPVTLSFWPPACGACDPAGLNLSAAAALGTTLFLACDETATIEVLEPDGPRHWSQTARLALGDWFDLPEGPEREIDIEGLSIADGALWVTGSHGRRRRKPRRGEDGPAALAALETLTLDANRYLFGRIPLSGARPVPRSEAPPARAPIALRMRHGRNRLWEVLAREPLLRPFRNLPCKENGFDVEGVVVRGRTALVGMRGPVLRGWATLVELRLRRTRPGGLGLARLGEGRARTHLLDLDGLGIRDLAMVGPDLLILAGPTMDLSGPVRLLRLRDALAVLPDLRVVPAARLEAVMDLPHGAGEDHPEGMTPFPLPDGRPGLLVAYDSPAKGRVRDDGLTVTADLLPLPS